MSLKPKCAGAIVAVAALLAGCASTTLQSTWSDPSYNAGPFKKIFVIGLSAKSVTSRRVFEDIMVAKLQAAGVQGVPAWQFLGNDGQADEASMQSSVMQSGADGVLIARLLGVDTQTNVSTLMVPGPGVGPGFGMGWYGAYAGWYAVPQVTQYQIATAETRLYVAQTKQLVWSATSETFNPTSVQNEAPGLADAVIRALQARGLLPAAK
jgi:hypothetical protein